MQYFGVGFLVLLFLEVMSIVWVADWLGGGIALFLMIISFALGLFMLRRVGLSGILLAAATMREGGHVSLYQMLWPIRYTVSGVLLMSPGFVSTLIAAILMLPLKGESLGDLGKTAADAFNRNPHTAHSDSFEQVRQTIRHRRQDDDVIEGEYTVTDDGSTNKHSS